MKRTILPKILGLLLIALVWSLWPATVALPVSVGIAALILLLLSIPVFNPRSNYYVPTISRAKGVSNRIALTFDDGPDPRYTMPILEQLDAENIRAAFFVVGSRAEQHPELIAAILDRGHIIGNHSHRHALSFHFSSPRTLYREFEDFDRVMQRISGRRCQLFRAPQGFRTPLLADVLRRRSLHCIGWSARGYDAVERDPRKILRAIRKDLKGGAIVLLHDGGGLGGREDRGATLKALPLLIQEIRAAGLSFERLDRLIGIEAYSQ